MGVADATAPPMKTAARNGHIAPRPGFFWVSCGGAGGALWGTLFKGRYSTRVNQATTPRSTSAGQAGRPRPAYSPLAGHWTLDPGTVFLNHGSFGATPRQVLLAQQRYRDLLEREPVRFFVEKHTGLVDEARAALGGFLNCPAESIAPVANATAAVATVLENLNLQPGDEVLTNQHEYPACQNNIRRITARTGARVVNVALPFPCTGSDQIMEALLAGVTGRTRLALISHVTSPTALVLPVDRLVPELTRRGVETLIDGAHAPGMVPGLDLSKLRPTYYTANCHKWICSPKGSAFLYVAQEKRDGFRPLVLSNNAEKPRPGRSQFLTEFEYIGTQDYTAFYAIPDAIACMQGLVPGGWPEVMASNHELCLKGRDGICKTLGIEKPAPDQMIGSTCTMILSPHPPELAARLASRPTRYHDALQDRFLDVHGIQVPVWGLAGRPERFVRISAQLYNSLEQYEYLAAVLKEELELERRF
jgi:isopenicillin-N epimerase